MKNVILYYPDGKTSYHEVNQKMLDKEGKETGIFVKSIKEEDNKIIVELSSDEIYLYSLPYSSRIK